MRTSGLLLCALAFTTAAHSQKQPKAFDRNDLIAGKAPRNFLNELPVVVKWTDDTHVILRQRMLADTIAKNYLLDVVKGSYTATTDVPAIAPESSSFGRCVFVKNNDVVYRRNGVDQQLTNDPAEEKNPIFSPDSNYVAYTRSNNLYTYNLLTNKETQLTTDGSSTTLNGYASWVYYEEIFGRSTRYRAFWWSPDSRKLAYMRFDESMVPMFPIYVSEGQHGYLEETRYPKAGDKNPEVKLGIVSPEGGTTVWADFNAKDDQYFGWPIWRPGTNQLWLPWMNRDQTNLKIYEVNMTNGQKNEVYNEVQSTWIDLEDRVGGRINFCQTGKDISHKAIIAVGTNFICMAWMER